MCYNMVWNRIVWSAWTDLVWYCLVWHSSYCMVCLDKMLIDNVWLLIYFSVTYSTTKLIYLIAIARVSNG